MTQDEFNKIRHGNVIKTEFDDLGVVSQVIRDESGNVKYVGWIPAFGIEQADAIHIVSDTTVETYLTGRTVFPPK